MRNSDNTLERTRNVQEPVPLEAASPKSRRTVWPYLLAVGLLAVALVLGALGLSWQGKADELAQDSAARDGALSVAEEAARLLLDLDAEQGEQTLDTLRGLATGDFAAEVDTLADTVAGVLVQGQVASDGDIAAAGVEDHDGSSATVLVAATALVTNSELPQGELRTFRLAISLTASGDVWKVADVEFLS